MRRYCKRCRTRREVDGRTPGSAQFCQSCLIARARGEPTQAQLLARDRAKKSQQRRQKALQGWLSALKRQHGCCICGEADPACLDFHHVNPYKKKLCISQLRTPSLAVLKEELSKCLVICSNCHRKHHKRLREEGRSSLEDLQRQPRRVNPDLLLSRPKQNSRASLEAERLHLLASLQRIDAQPTHPHPTSRAHRRELIAGLVRIDAALEKLSQKDLDSQPEDSEEMVELIPEDASVAILGE